MITHHARVRARQRYGFNLTPQDAVDIEKQVTDGRAIKLSKRGRIPSVYLITVQGQDAVIVYNRKAKIIITFLPLHWEREWKKQKLNGSLKPGTE